MPGSVGHLYLDVKLQTDQVEAQLRKIASQWEMVNKQAGGRGGAASAAQAQASATRQTTAAIEAQVRATQQATQATTQQGRAAQAAAKQQIQASNAATDATVKNAKKSASALKAMTAGSTELLVGLGAARSGNIFYGLAAGTRYIKNVTASLGEANLAMKALAGGAAITGMALVGVGAGVAFLGAKAASFGLESAANLEMLNIQLTGLLGNAGRASQEMDFLLRLGKESIVPTQSLIAADRQLLAFGVTADNTRRNLVQFFSDFGTATGASEQQVYFLSLALGQVAAVGKANMIDMRQLANAGINTMEIYRIVGKEIGKSAQEVAAGVSDGLITADLLYSALDKYGGKFAAAAETARNSTQGLLSNIKDIVTTEMGRAFESLNKGLGKVLKVIQKVVEGIDYQAIADAAVDAANAILNAFAPVQVSTDDLVKSFNEDIPNAIRNAGEFFAMLIRVVQTVAKAFEVAAHMIVVIADLAIVLITAMQGVLNDLMDKAGLVSDEVGQITRDQLKQQAADWSSFAEDTWNRMSGLVTDIANLWSSTSPVMYLRIAVVPPGPFGPDGRPARAIDASTPPYVPPTPQLPTTTITTGSGGVGSSSGGTTTTPPNPAANVAAQATRILTEAAQAWLAKYREIYQQANAAREEFVDLVRQPFGEPSQIQEAFTSGSVSTIIGMYDTLEQNLRDFYKGVIASARELGPQAVAAAKAARAAALAELRADVTRLIALAKRADQITNVELPKLDEWFQTEGDKIRDNITKLDEWRSEREQAINDMYDGLLESANQALDVATSRYEEANNKLQELIAQRDQFLNAAGESMRTFVNGLQLIEKDVQEFTRLDLVGSFLVESKKETQGFKETLSDRLNTLRTWTANIRSLIAKGLDSDLIKQLVSAGVEGSGDVVSQLAGADDATIAGINQIQSELLAEIGAFQTDASAAWFDAGIAQQEAYVAPLRDAMNAAAAYVSSLETQRKQALDALKASYDEQKAMYDQQLVDLEANYQAQKEALQAELALIETEMQTLADKVNAQFTALSTSMEAQGIAVMDGVIDGMNSREDDAIRNARRIARAIRDAFAGVFDINSPSRVMAWMGQMIGAGLVSGMDSMGPKVNAASTRMAMSALPAPSLRSVSLPRSGAITGASMSAMSLSGAGSSAGVNVKVFIGDKELTDIVDYRIEAADARSLDYVSSGRRI